LIDGLKLETFDAESFVFREGDGAKSFYIIEFGEVECLKALSDGKYETVRVLI
jgi:CRP-like cAMP-binding protein